MEDQRVARAMLEVLDLADEQRVVAGGVGVDDARDHVGQCSGHERHPGHVEQRDVGPGTGRPAKCWLTTSIDVPALVDAAEYGVSGTEILRECGGRRLIGGQEDLIGEIAVDLSAAA
jgi:DmpG-like communication domain